MVTPTKIYRGIWLCLLPLLRSRVWSWRHFELAYLLDRLDQARRCHVLWGRMATTRRARAIPSTCCVPGGLLALSRLLVGRLVPILYEVCQSLLQAFRHSRFYRHVARAKGLSIEVPSLSEAMDTAE